MIKATIYYDEEDIEALVLEDVTRRFGTAAPRADQRWNAVVKYNSLYSRVEASLEAIELPSTQNVKRDATK
jgi:hypothetical protein